MIGSGIVTPLSLNVFNIFNISVITKTLIRLHTLIRSSHAAVFLKIGVVNIMVFYEGDVFLKR